MIVTRICLFGGLGRMGRAVVSCAEDSAKARIAQIVEREKPGLANEYRQVPVAPRPNAPADVYMDFTVAGAVEGNLELALRDEKPFVTGTTGLSDETMARLIRAGRRIPVVCDSNMSVGVTALRELVREARALRNVGFDVEIVEKHHRHKLDSPSGTAKSLLEQFEDVSPVHGRQGKGKRTDDEVGVHAVRAGGIFGEHTVIFSSETETVELTHRLITRNALASGALEAAVFASGAKVGFYTMADVWHSLRK
ncbi:MAG: 4-hydroxy-tetrahydrodipicolinate reductase [Planctomycetota bacterium]|nr:4-hydroxy-tetrahydrodipicolinate reductase [Planctomycetota bacterium]